MFNISFHFVLLLSILNTVPELKSKVNTILMGLMCGQSLHFFSARKAFDIILVG